MIAHRGASGYRPEHTLAAYQLAIALGADFIEPDLVSTSDGVLVARHESNIAQTTDVADHPEFAARHATKVIDGIEQTGWFTEDFTFAELRTLRAVERLPELRRTNALYNGDFLVPSLEEILDLAGRFSTPHRKIGVYPETKHPTYFRALGLPLEPALLGALDSRRLNHRGAPIFIQSFEVSNLRALRQITDVPLIQLLKHEGRAADHSLTSYPEMLTAAGLAGIASYADGIGPDKRVVDAALVTEAHALGLQVHPWTFRAENCFLEPAHRSGEANEEYGDLAAEIRTVLDCGVDGIFCDFPDIAAAAINDLVLVREW
ncbi:glycerophosphoryl diester phosphodiesterase [Antricoccus suffuscus]|uniref:glycerophosphodiester phosphodiesterase n=1 Tax=Antricoccus suffuscus TaxID=1629062 RepID=A0A2T1A1U8_9ACTN|nr:glycerophosphoryl diester phosphodiesterase [Antricoccus suffuscus]